MKIFIKAVCCGLVVAALLSMTGFCGACEDIRNEVFRLHIVANSDSEEDQQLKLRVRDEVLEYTEGLFLECQSRDEAIESAKENIENIRSYAEGVVRKYGYSYSVDAKVVDMCFDTRVYDDVTLPAGRYDALRIVIGEGKGHNWWCVLYPAMCISASKGDELSTLVNDGEEDIINESDKYTVKLKVVEWFEYICSIF